MPKISRIKWIKRLNYSKVTRKVMQVNNDASLSSWLHTNVFLISHTNNREKYDLLVIGLAFPNLAVAMETARFLFGCTSSKPKPFKLCLTQKAQILGDFGPNIFQKLFFNCVYKYNSHITAVINGWNVPKWWLLKGTNKRLRNGFVFSILFRHTVKVWDQPKSL